MAIGATSIWPTESAVVIQAPSSKPACTAPRMSARPNEESRVVNVEMNVPSNTANSPIQGIPVAGAGAAAGAAEACAAGAGAAGAGGSPCVLIDDRGAGYQPGQRRTCR